MSTRSLTRTSGGGSTRRISLLSRDPPEVQDLKREISDLKKQLLDRDRVNEVLVSENESLVKQNEDLRHENDIATNEVQDLLEEVEDLNDEVKDLQKEVKSLEKQRDDLEEHYELEEFYLSKKGRQEASGRFASQENRGGGNASTSGTAGTGNAGMSDNQTVISEVSQGTTNGSVTSQEGASFTPSAGLQTFNTDNQHQHLQYQMKHRLAIAQQEREQMHKELDRIRKERDDLIEQLMKAQQEKSYLIKRVKKCAYQANHYEWIAREVQDIFFETTEFVKTTLLDLYRRHEAMHKNYKHKNNRRPPSLHPFPSTFSPSAAMLIPRPRQRFRHPLICHACHYGYFPAINTVPPSDGRPTSLPQENLMVEGAPASGRLHQQKKALSLAKVRRKAFSPKQGPDILAAFNNSFVPPPRPLSPPPLPDMLLDPPIPDNEEAPSHPPSPQTYRYRSEVGNNRRAPPPPPPSLSFDASTKSEETESDPLKDAEAIGRFASRLATNIASNVNPHRRISNLANNPRARAIGARSTSMVQRIASSPRAIFTKTPKVGGTPSCDIVPSTGTDDEHGGRPAGAVSTNAQSRPLGMMLRGRATSVPAMIRRHSIDNSGGDSPSGNNSRKTSPPPTTGGRPFSRMRNNSMHETGNRKMASSMTIHEVPPHAPTLSEHLEYDSFRQEENSDAEDAPSLLEPFQPQRATIFPTKSTKDSPQSRLVSPHKAEALSSKNNKYSPFWRSAPNSPTHSPTSERNTKAPPPIAFHELSLNGTPLGSRRSSVASFGISEEDSIR